ncbi:unnamed protein product, partial [Ceratitis capitata]
ELNERGGQERISTPADSSPTTYGRSNYSVKEIPETIPDFDPQTIHQYQLNSS